jgi:molybdopterin molybdotransferase
MPPSREQSGLTTVDEHLANILKRISALPTYQQPLMDALGLPVAEDIHSPVSLPIFDNSAMDGYAVVFRDVAEASAERPVHLPVVGEIAAGQTRIFAMSPGTAVRIMTGAPIPQGCDAVVPFEWTDEGIAQVLIHRAPGLGEHVRRAGEEISKGDLLMPKGTMIGARQLGLLASVGFGQVPTPPRPRVVVLSTGSELVDPGTPLGRDSIFDANSYLLAAAAKSAGAIAYRVASVSDDPDSFSEAINDQLVRADVVVTSGGVSKGTHDVVKEVLRELGTVDFLEVAMQPGKPQGFGVIGEDATPIFTLPGNPVSSYISFEVFVVPALRKMMGREPYARPLVRASCTTDLTSMRGRRQFLRAQIATGPGGATVTPVGGAGSHLVAGLAGANALIVIAEDITRIEAGQPVPVMMLDREF